MVGNVNTETVYSSYSYTDRVLDSLECLIRNNDALKYTDEHKEIVESELNGATATTSEWKLMPLFNIINTLEQDANVPGQRVSFLAKKLHISKYGNKTIIIGSPLFISLNE